MTDDRAASTVGLVGQTRAQALADTFVVLADTLVDDYDVVDLLDTLVDACVEVLGATAAGLLIDDQKGNLAVLASSTEETRLLEVFQLQNNEGPCLECLATGSIVASDDLTDARERWPLFAPAAVEAGFRSVVAVPLRLRAQTVGGLNLFSADADSLSADDQRLAQALADVATIGILQRRSLHRSTQVAEQLQHALNSRVTIEQAKGVLAERDELTMEQAFAALRAHARNHNLKLTEVALAVVNGTLRLDPAPSAAGRTSDAG